MADFNTFITSLRTEFGEQKAGKKFEVFCKWFLENDPEWSKIVHEVWLWDEYPNKWQTQDLGTDLVFKDTEGRVWAVQAKCYSEHRATTKDDMNSFLADSSRKGVHRRLWMQTTNRIESNAEKTLKGQDKPIIVFTLDDFRKSNLDYPISFSELYKVKPKEKPKPDLHQKEAIDAVVNGLKKSDRGQMIMACGTGKTFTTLWIKEAINAQTTLVLLPSLNLLSQTMREWAWAAADEFDIMSVCSDKSVGRVAEDMKVSEVSFPVTSELTELSNFLKKQSKKVVFCTYQSSPLIAEAQLDESILSFDLTIADEAHRCAGKTEAGFSTVLDGQKIRSNKRLFTTATPRYFGKAVKDAAKIRDVAIVGMDNVDVFGPVMHQLTFGEAIQRNLLNDYQVIIVGVDEPSVKSLIDNYEIVSSAPDNQTDARTLAAKIGLIKAIKDYNLRRCISFHSRVKGAKEFSEEFTKVVGFITPTERPKGNFYSDYVSGEMKTRKRLDKISRLKSLEGYDGGVVCNARCLAEGVDVPSLDGIAFIDPRGSQIDIIQAVGRAIRKVRGETAQNKGTIVIPVFIEAGDNPEASIEASNFKPVWDVLNALRAHDEILAETLDKHRGDLARYPKKFRAGIDKLIFDLPVSVGQEFGSSLRTVLVEASTSSWVFWFSLLQQYKEENGDCFVPSKFKTQDGFSLGTWVHKQRGSEESLSEKQKEQLLSIGFSFDYQNENWEHNFRELKKYKAQYGDCLVPTDYRTNSNFRLGYWVNTQRRSPEGMSSTRRRQLSAIGFIWNSKELEWVTKFSALQEFKKENGHCLVPSDFYTKDNVSLGTWVQYQRANESGLSSQQKASLNSIGFIWNVSDYEWEEAFKQLVLYKSEHGDCLVPNKYQTSDGNNLGIWVSNQRRNKRTLDTQKKLKLEQLGFIWDAQDYAWEQRFLLLELYKEENGDCLVPTGYRTSDGVPLGSWVKEQRKKAKEENFSAERKARLDALGFQWKVRNKQ